MNKERILFSLIICIIILIYPIMFTAEHLPMIIHSDDYIKLGFAVENNTLYNIKLTEKEIGRRVDIFHIFQKIDEEPKLEDMQEILDSGYTLLLTLEPWPGRKNLTNNYTPRAIINGSIDQDIDKWVIALSSLKFTKGKFIIRTMHEINGNWYPWGAYTKGSSPEDSKNAYIYMVNKLRYANRDIMFMYGIHYRGIRYDNKNGTEFIYDIDNILPDEEYYDIIGLSGYNRFSKNYKWRSFDELYRPMYINLTNATNKSIWIAEISTISKGGDKAEWIKDMFDQIRNNYTRIDAIVWFDENKWFEGEITDWRFDSTEDSKITFIQSVKFDNMKKKKI